MLEPEIIWRISIVLSKKLTNWPESNGKLHDISALLRLLSHVPEQPHITSRDNE